MQTLLRKFFLRYSFNLNNAADAIEQAIQKALADGYRTGDLADENTSISTSEMGDVIAKNILA